ncbi:beta-class carbonic anhydrase [Pseudalkalibacillus berkeleyi]|uniref:carbonic anhydrase n=1 Tax=Pseudalkalibacillus berkeleyi TaxID=1069813 RepID=A0ABS9GYV2_9BACL|nr:carbonic anhydrase [Pseudalkalibacillus berkeleyi]MCF6136673.1 carbonic anhydrase [Pseudalkalibacillus berkeleyi]
MQLLDEVLSFNESFVQEKQYEPYVTSKLPDKKMVIVSCMDTRLVELLPKAMNLSNGDFKSVKNAGAIVSDRFDSVMRSILVAVYELNADEVFVIGHHQCGMSSVDPEKMISKFKDRGVSEDTVDTLEHAGIDLKNWLKGFDSVESSVENSVDVVKNHPLLPKDTPVHGLVIAPDTGKLDLIVNGYE